MARKQYMKFSPSQLRAHKMIFTAQVEQMDLNTLAHIRFCRLGWGEEVTGLGVGSPGGWGRCPTQGGWHALQSMPTRLSSEKPPGWGQVMLFSIPTSWNNLHPFPLLFPDLHPAFSLLSLLPFFPAKIFKADPTQVPTQSHEMRSVTSFDPPPSANNHTVQIQKAKLMCSHTQARAKLRLSSQTLKSLFQYIYIFFPNQPQAQVSKSHTGKLLKDKRGLHHHCLSQLMWGEITSGHWY